MSCLGTPSNKRWRVSWRRCQCVWGVWAFDRLSDWQLQPSGHLGRTRCRCSKSCQNSQFRLSTACLKHQLSVQGTCRQRRTCWIIVGSWDVHPGRNCAKGQDQVRVRLSQVSGRMVGSISRFLLLNTHFRETVALAQSCAVDKAHLRSHSGGGCADVLSGCPTAPEFTLQPIVFAQSCWKGFVSHF